MIKRDDIKQVYDKNKKLKPKFVFITNQDLQ